MAWFSSVHDLIEHYEGIDTLQTIQEVAQDFPESLEERHAVHGGLPLHTAILHERTPVIGWLLQCNPSAATQKDYMGDLPIHLCLRSCSIPVTVMCDIIQTFPTGVKIPDRNGEIALHLAMEQAEFRRSLQLYDKLKETLECSKRSKLHNGEAENDTHKDFNHLLDFILDHDPDASKIKNGRGDIPLHCICHCLDTDETFAHKLIQANPRGIQQEDSSGSTIFHSIVATSSLSHQCKVSLLTDIWNSFPLLAQNGAQKPNRVGQLPLHTAVLMNNTDMVRFFVKKIPMATYAPDRKGNLPIHLLQANCSLEIVDLILERSLSTLSIQNSHGMTALHCLINSAASFDCIKHIVEKGCTDKTASPLDFLKVQDNEGHTPLHTAILGNPQTRQVVSDECLQWLARTCLRHLAEDGMTSSIHQLAYFPAKHGSDIALASKNNDNVSCMATRKRRVSLCDDDGGSDERSIDNEIKYFSLKRMLIAAKSCV